MSLDVKSIQDSFNVVQLISDKVVSRFYETLWEDYPDSKNLFDLDKMENQKKALTNALAYVVNNLENQEKLATYLENLGRRHVDYGTKDEHYSWVGESLIKTFAYFFGDDWTPHLQEQWLTAYNFVADTMKKGAQIEIKSSSTQNEEPVHETAETVSEESVPDPISTSSHSLESQEASKTELAPTGEVQSERQTESKVEESSEVSTPVATHIPNEVETTAQYKESLPLPQEVISSIECVVDDLIAEAVQKELETQLKLKVSKYGDKNELKELFKRIYKS